MENPVFEQEQHYGELNALLKKELKDKPTIFRLTGQKSRIYFTKPLEHVPACIYNSGTTLIDNYRDKEGEQALMKWKVDLINKGLDPNEVVKTRQDYGTILHVLYGKILLGEKTSFEDLQDFLISFSDEVKMKKSYITALVSSHIEEFKKDLASLLTWIKEYNIKPLGIEVMLKSEKYRVATALDLICYATFKEKGFWGEVYKSGENKGNPKESYKEVTKLVIVDFKSGKKGFYHKNILQLLLSRVIFEENFSLKVEGIFNFAPNDWLTSPTFKFYDQERESKQIGYLKAIAENVFQRGLVEFNQILSKKEHRVLKGEIDVNNINLDSIVSYVNLEQLADYYYIKANTKVDVFEELIKTTKIDNTLDFRVYLNKLPATELKDLAIGIGIKYTTKQDFIKKVNQKFIEYNGKRETTIQTES